MKSVVQCCRTRLTKATTIKLFFHNSTAENATPVTLFFAACSSHSVMLSAPSSKAISIPYRDKNKKTPLVYCFRFAKKMHTYIVRNY
jgi:ankyrin repeat protein